MRAPRRWLLTALMVLAASSCASDTSGLPDDLSARFEAEGVARRADNMTVRETTRDAYGESRWRDRRASIVLTSRTFFLHVNGRPIIQISPRTRRSCAVRRIGTRIRLEVEGNSGRLVYSFEPPEDAEGWAKDLRSILTQIPDRRGPSGG